MTDTIALTDQNFDAIITRAPRPVVLEFWAIGQRPASGHLAQLLAGHASVTRLDVDANPELALRLGVKSLPGFAVFSGGQLVYQGG